MFDAATKPCFVRWVSCEWVLVIEDWSVGVISALRWVVILVVVIRIFVVFLVRVDARLGSLVCVIFCSCWKLVLFYVGLLCVVMMVFSAVAIALFWNCVMVF